MQQAVVGCAVAADSLVFLYWTNGSCVAPRVLFFHASVQFHPDFISCVCLEQSWAKFSVPSSVTHQWPGSVHFWQALPQLHRSGKSRNVWKMMLILLLKEKRLQILRNFIESLHEYWKTVLSPHACFLPCHYWKIVLMDLLDFFVLLLRHNQYKHHAEHQPRWCLVKQLRSD